MSQAILVLAVTEWGMVGSRIVLGRVWKRVIEVKMVAAGNSRKNISRSAVPTAPLVSSMLNHMLVCHAPPEIEFHVRVTWVCDAPAEIEYHVLLTLVWSAFGLCDGGTKCQSLKPRRQKT